MSATPCLNRGTAALWTSRGLVGAADPLGHCPSKCATSGIHAADEITQRVPGLKDCEDCITGSFANICLVLLRHGRSSICAAVSSTAERRPSEPTVQTPPFYASSKCDFKILWLGSLVMDIFVPQCFVTRHVLHWWICVKLTGLPWGGSDYDW